VTIEENKWLNDFSAERLMPNTEKSSIFIALFLNLFTQASPYLMMLAEPPLFCASWNNQLWL